MAKLTSQGRHDLMSRQFAFAAQRREPLEDAGHIRNAVARFGRVGGVSDAERDAAWRRIQDAAKRFGVQLHEQDWRELMQSR